MILTQLTTIFLHTHCPSIKVFPNLDHFKRSVKEVEDASTKQEDICVNVKTVMSCPPMDKNVLTDALVSVMTECWAEVDAVKLDLQLQPVRIVYF